MYSTCLPIRSISTDIGNKQQQRGMRAMPTCALPSGPEPQKKGVTNHESRENTTGGKNYTKTRGNTNIIFNKIK